MSQTLETLIKEANSVFSDGFILAQYRRVPSALRPIEQLAQFIVADMRDLYDPASSERENLRRIVANLDLASAQLTLVAKQLRDLHMAALS